MKGDRIVIPKELRADILLQLHTPHQGIEKTRQSASSCLLARVEQGNRRSHPAVRVVCGIWRFEFKGAPEAPSIA